MTESSIRIDQRGVFWALQVGGWLAYFLLRLLPVRMAAHPTVLLPPAIVATASGFCLTLILASVFHRAILRGGTAQWITSVSALCVAALIFSYLEVWSHKVFVETDWSPRVWEFLALAFVDFYVLAAWSGAYFGISYFLMAQQQRQRMLELTAQVHHAQLTMLRYQLNPHFLFNTLNSISTLVLINDAPRANAMLARLSEFLRATLTADSNHTVRLADDIITLQAYLDIERMRFQDRLRLKMEIDPAAADTPIPPLLLQPIIENALKYAVAPSETGATITIKALRLGDITRLEVSDTGPGWPSDAPGGVGLANTRARLEQLYGKQHSLLITQRDPHGVTITIDLPAVLPPLQEVLA